MPHKIMFLTYDSWQRVCYARHKHDPNAVSEDNDDPMTRFSRPASMDCIEMPFNEDKEIMKHHSLLGGARMDIVSTVSVSRYQGINIVGIQPIYGVMLAYDEVNDALSRGPLSGNERKLAFSVSISDAQDPVGPDKWQSMIIINGNESYLLGKATITKSNFERSNLWVNRVIQSIENNRNAGMITYNLIQTPQRGPSAGYSYSSAPALKNVYSSLWANSYSIIRDLVKGGPASPGDALLTINNDKYMVKYINEAGEDFQVNNGVVHVQKLLSIMRHKEVGYIAVASHNLIGDDDIPLHVEHFLSYATQETTNIAAFLHMFFSCLYTRGFGYMKMQLKGFKPA